MNREQIIRMMCEACDKDKVDPLHNGFWTITQEELERFAALVAAAEYKRLRETIHSCHANCDHPVCVAVRKEREACARLAEGLPMQQEIDVRDQCAASIRARGQA